ncbi:FAD-dependent oxidoreductase [Actinoplanes sp. TBRC 11911]|uniref:FAD-dependent monooxygenase n=1 Tax=Actinoplanes sp. TBRC 11911 TaxID=2729386 RepID=UPI00145C8896|nr:FAD-dependent monooxygenase [Actinoplanes sp. TBRC 11911]NMO56650.1 FAD-dependent oxidoreductase [Actinoplanes sp. TBRC 11911]
MEFDVVIAGGGPNGLMLSCELALSGVRPLVLEKRTGELSEQRANGMVGQVVRLFERRGLYQRLTGDGKPPEPAPNFMFAAYPLGLSELSDNPVYTVLVPQRRIEAMLAERALELGVVIEKGRELGGFTQKDDRVVLDDGRETRYLIGADGGHSTVRKLASIDFPGVTTDRTVSRVAHVSVPAEYVDRGGLRVPGFGVIPPFLHQRTERGLIAYAPFPNGPSMISVSTLNIPEPDAPFTIEELREAFAYVAGFDIPFGPSDKGDLLRRTSGRNTRIADRYRDGRVFLVGDAAHVHGAIGGPGLNLGLQDAANLGWKLAAAVRGWAPEGLLDTYESERRPAAERVTMHTQAQTALVGPGPEITALRVLFGELLSEPSVVRRLAGLIAGSDVTYDMGETSALAGHFGPDLGEATRSGRPLLVDNTGTLAPVAAPWRDRVDVISTPLDGATALLVRPDCYVAWASREATPDPAALRRAMTRWFSAPGSAAA